MKQLRGRLSYANVMATIAVFAAIGGGAYAVTKSAQPVKGGGKIVSGVRNFAPGPFQTLVKLPGIGAIKGSCGTNAQSAGWGFSSARHPADIVTTDAAGVPDDNNSLHVAGHHHGFTSGFAGLGPTYPVAEAFLQLSSGANSGAKSATVTLSVLNGGDPSPNVAGIGNNCRFRVQAIRQP
jgi:hypothetical protein